MISYRAERNICYRIFKSKHNKAPNLFIIHNNHNLSAEGRALLQGPRVPFHTHPLLQPADPQSWSVPRDMLWVLLLCLEENMLNLISVGSKFHNQVSNRVLYLPRKSKEENYTVEEEGGLNLISFFRLSSLYDGKKIYFKIKNLVMFLPRTALPMTNSMITVPHDG